MVTGTIDLLASDLNGAYIDALTNIGNRRYFERMLTDTLNHSASTGCTTILLLLDLDRFKAVNDSLGHAAGDALLRKVSERVASQLNDTDVFARLGGDEFGIILREKCDEADLATRIIELVQRTFLIEGSPVNVGVSIGVAISPVDASEGDGLLRAADFALYEAKARGRNCFVNFEPYMEIMAKERREMEIDLRKAVAMRQLEIHYRPQIDISTQQLLGLEAMMY